MFRIYAFISFFICFRCGAFFAQVASYYPQTGDLDGDITIVINLNLVKDSRAEALLSLREGLYLWSGAGTEANPFLFTPPGQIDFEKPYPPGLMTFLGNNRWKIAMNPRQYFKVPEGQTIEALGLILKNADGSAQTENLILRAVPDESLQTVVVTSKRTFIEQRPDRVVISPDADPLALASTTFEILQKAPGLSTAGDETLRMNGRSGLAVYIDGKPSRLEGRDLTNYLQSLPGGAVENIELYANPPARFDAEGNAGIINIRLKKGLSDGVNGSANAAYTQNIHYRSQGGLNLNVRKSAVNVYGQASAQRNLQHTDGFLNREAQGNVYRNTTTNIDATPMNAQYRMGVDWTIDKHRTAGFLWNGRYNAYDSRTPARTRVSDAQDQTLFWVETQNDLTIRQRFTGYDFNFQQNNDKRFNLNADLDWTRFRGRQYNDILNTFFQVDSFETSSEGLRNTFVNALDAAFLRADLQFQPEHTGMTVEAGFKSAFSLTRNTVDARNLKENAQTLDSLRSVQFDYRENIQAAYVTLSGKTGHWSWQAGIRGEYTTAKGESQSRLQTRLVRPDTMYFNVFPSAFLQWTPSEYHGFKLAWTRRIDRPAYTDLNPFEVRVDAYTSEIGNPYLRPAFTHNVEFSYDYRQAAGVSIGANRTREPLQWITILQGENGYATTANTGVQENVYANLNIPLPIKNWWFMYLYVGAYYNHYRADLPDGPFTGGQWGSNGYMSHQFTLPDGFRAQAEAWWNVPTRELIYRNLGLGSLNLSVQKTILQGKADVRLGIYDVFNTQRWRQSAQFGLQQFDLYRKWESRGVRAAFSYRFGNRDIKNARERRSGADEASERLKEKSSRQ